MKSHLNFGRIVMRKLKNKNIVPQYVPVLQPAWYNGRRLNDFYFCKYDGIRYLIIEHLQKLIYRAKHRKLYLTYKDDIKQDFLYVTQHKMILGDTL